MPRRLYWIDFPLLLMIAGLADWIFPTDLLLFISALIGSAVALFTLWEFVARRGPIRFSHLICISQLGGYALGVVNSWLTLPRGDLPLAAYFGRSSQLVTNAMGAILICAAILYSLGELYERPVFTSDFRLFLDNRAVTFVALGTGLVITGYFTGQLGFNGIAHEGGHISILGGVLTFVVPTLFAVTCFCFIHWHKGIVKWFFGASLAIQFILLIPTGRRSILYCVLLAFIAVRFWHKKQRWAFTKKALYTSIAMAAIVLGSIAFYYIRWASWSRRDPISTVDRVSLAMALYESGNTSEVNDALRTNLQKRTFVIGYVSDLLNASFSKRWADGEGAWHALELATPSAFWENKDEFLYGEETIANNTFGFNYNDEANSLYSAGIIDFGMWGMVAYPIIMAALYWLVAWCLKMWCRSDVATIVILYLIYAALQTEWELATHITAIRGAIIYAACLSAIFIVPAFALKARQQTQSSISPA